MRSHLRATVAAPRRRAMARHPGEPRV